MISLKRIEKAIIQEERKLLLQIDDLTEEMAQLRTDCEKSFYVFAKTFWEQAGSDRPYIDNWHVQAMAEHLQACYEGQIKYLIINIPPGMAKSLIASVTYPAWVWIKDPIKRFLFPSYAEGLSVKDNRWCQMLLNSDLYKKFWRNNFSLNYQQATSTYNNKGGYRLSCGFSGTITGHRVWAIIADDPNSMTDVYSKAMRNETNRIWDSTLSTRLNDMETGVRIVIQQRSHSQDVTGYILAKELPDVVHLRLPMEFEPKYKCKTIKLLGQNKVWEDPRKKDRELLFPALFTEKHAEQKKMEFSAYNWSGQFQQRPAPEEGGILQKEWFEWWCESHPPECEFILQSWDTALMASETSAYSACTTWGVFKDEGEVPNIILLNMWRGRVEYPELRHMAQRLSQNYHDTNIDDPLGPGPSPDIILIEEKVSGISLIQDLRRAGVYVTAFNPRRKGKGDSSKEARARIVSSVIEGGRVWLPARPPNYQKLYRYAETFLEACASFPNDEDSKDIVDTMSQALLHLMNHRWIGHPEDEDKIETHQYKYQETRPLY